VPWEPFIIHADHFNAEDARPLDEMIRDKGPIIIETLVHMAMCGNLQAAMVLLAYGWGPPSGAQGAAVSAAGAAALGAPRIRWDKMTKAELAAVSTMLDFNARMKNEGQDDD